MSPWDDPEESLLEPVTLWLTGQLFPVIPVYSVGIIVTDVIVVIVHKKHTTGIHVICENNMYVKTGCPNL